MTAGPMTNGSGARTRWTIAWLMVGAGVVCAFQVGKMPASIPLLQEELGLSLVEAGLAASMFNAVACFVGMMAGLIADVAGARRMIVAGLVATAAASIGGAFATDGTTLLISRFIEGFGAIAVFVSGPIIIMRAVMPADVRQAFGVWGTYMPLGIAMMIAMTPFLLDPLGWEGLWIANGAVLLAFAVLFAIGTRAIPDPPAAERAGRLKTVRRDARTVLGSRGPWLFGVCFATYTGNFQCVTMFLPTYFILRLGYDPVLAALATAAVVLANVPGNLVGGRLLKLGAPRSLLIGGAAAAMGLITIGIYAPGVPTWLPFVLALAFSFIGGCIPSSVLSAAAVHAPTPRQVGASGGLVVQIGNIGQWLGPPGIAAVVAVNGWEAGWWVTLTLGALGVAFAVAIGFYERGRRPRAEAS